MISQQLDGRRELSWALRERHTRSFDQTEPLTEAELDRLNEFLNSYTGGTAMNIEEVDGFFCALIAGPEVVMPSEYLPELFGSETSETRAFSTLAEADEILGLLM